MWWLIRKVEVKIRNEQINDYNYDIAVTAI